MIRKTLFVWFLLAISGAGAMGQSEPEPGSKAWVEAQIERARNFEIPKGFRFKWREEQYRLMTDAELAQARKRVAKKPDHPDRFTIMCEEQRIEKGADIWEPEVLYGDEKHWRFNRTTLAPNQTFGDMGVDGNRAWQFSPSQIQYLNADTPPVGYEPTTRQGIFTAAVRRFILGPFDLSSRFGYVVMGIEVGPDGNWLCKLQRDDNQYGWELIGNTSSGTLIIRERKIYKINRTQWALQGIAQYSSVQQNEVLGEGLYHRVEYNLTNGDTSRINKLLSVQKLKQSELRDALKLPKIRGKDLIRGEVTTVQLVDLRGSSPVVFDHLSDGTTTKTVINSERTSEKQTSEKTWRIIGWFAGFVVVMCAVFIWRHGKMH